MNELNKIIESATNASDPVSNLLRKVLVLARRAHNQDLEEWVSRELSGYPSGVDVPSYRQVAAPAFGNFVGPFNSQVNNFAIPSAALPEGLRHFAEEAHLRQAIAEIEQWSKTSEGTVLQVPWPGNLVMAKGDQILQGHQLLGAHQVINRAKFHAIVDTVRNKVLDFALQLQEVTEKDASNPTPSAQDVGQAFNLTIGSVMNLSVGNPGTLTQTATFIVPGDVAGLKAYLASIGVAPDEVGKLEEALKQDAADGPSSRSKTLGWLSRLGSTAWAATAKVGKELAIDLATKAVLAYFQVPG